jgi:hypothetical protein
MVSQEVVVCRLLTGFNFFCLNKLSGILLEVSKYLVGWPEGIQYI